MATEQDILDNLQGVDDEVTLNDDTSTEDTTSTSDASQQGDTEARTASETQRTEAQPVRQRDDTRSTEEGSTQQHTQGTKFRTQLRYDSNQNVIGDDGRVLAKAGRERQYYEGWINARDTASVLREHNAQLQQQLHTAQVLNDMPKQLGLSMTEVESAMHMMRQMKQSPVETVKQLIAHARASGLDLGDALPQHVDIQAIRAMLDERLGPMTRQHEAQVAEQQIVQEAQIQAAQFFAQYPDAATHEDAIAALVRDHGKSPTEAYWMIREYAARQGLDFGMPLREQLLQRQQGAVSTQQPTTQSTAPRQQTATRVQGTQVAGRTQQQLHSVNDDLAPANASWSEIVKNAMRNNGYDI